MEEKKCNLIFCGNSEEELKKIDSSTVDLIVTSPPYDDIRNYGKNIQDLKYNGFSFPFEKIAKELYRVMKIGGVVVWVVGDSIINGGESGTSFKQALFFKEIGFNIHDTMIYEKNSSSFPAKKNGNRYSQIFEYMFIFSKGKPKTVNLLCDKPNRWAGHTSFGKCNFRGKDGALKSGKKIQPVPEFSPRNNIWKYNTGYKYSSKDKVAFQHPAIFPEQLAEDHILTWSNVGDLILDPFAGSGTTLKMAKKNKRSYIGIEINEEYCKICEERLKLVE